MKKNFLKKLASVLSLALVVSTITPAASASAAVAPNLAKRYTNVYEGSSYAYTVKNAKGYTVKWTVSGAGAEYVNLSAKTGAKTTVTVDTDAELAAKNKNATVKASFYKGGKLVKSAGDVIKVKVSATGLGIVAADADVKLDAIPAGEVVDFNRTITPANATSITTWSVTDKDGNATTDATVDGTGNFKADKVGEYVVKAVARNAKNGKDIVTAEQAVKVVLAIKDVKQLSLNKLEVTFGADASKVVTKTNIAVEAKDTKANSYVKEVTFSADGKVATVEVYNNFVDKKEYTVTYDKKAVGFIASVGEVAQVVVKDKVVKYATPTPLNIALLDANGIDVTTNDEMKKVSAKITNSISGWVDYPANGEIKITLYNIGDVATVSATYATGKFDTAGKSIDVTSNVATITSVKDLVVEGNLTDYTAVVSGVASLDWTKTVKKIAKEDTGKLQIKAVVDGTAIDSSLISSNRIEFESSNSNILLVDKNGNFTAVNEGVAYVTAKIDDKYTVVFSIEVGAKRAAASIALNKTSVTLSNKIAAGDSTTVKVIIKDQYGNDMKISASNQVKSTQLSTGTSPVVITTPNNTDTVPVSIPYNAATGTYQYKLEAYNLTARLDVTVVSATNTNVVSWRIVQTEPTFDLKVDKDTVNTVNTITVDGYNNAGVKVLTGITPGAVDADNDGTADDTLTLTIKDPDGTVVPGTAINLVTKNSVVGSEAFVKNAKVGKYTITVDVALNGATSATTRATADCVVTDTQALPNVSVDKIKATDVKVTSGQSIDVALNTTNNKGVVTAVLGSESLDSEGNAVSTIGGKGLRLTGASSANIVGVIDASGKFTNQTAGSTHTVYVKTLTFTGAINVNGVYYNIDYVVTVNHNMTFTF